MSAVLPVPPTAGPLYLQTLLDTVTHTLTLTKQACPYLSPFLTYQTIFMVVSAFCEDLLSSSAHHYLAYNFYLLLEPNPDQSLRKPDVLTLTRNDLPELAQILVGQPEWLEPVNNELLRRIAKGI